MPLTHKPLSGIRTLPVRSGSAGVHPPYIMQMQYQRRARPQNNEEVTFNFDFAAAEQRILALAVENQRSWEQRVTQDRLLELTEDFDHQMQVLTCGLKLPVGFLNPEVPWKPYLPTVWERLLADDEIKT